jgi:nanoRNase/pAp phosphatase (c-di-AMP/oligoRNAs hydrolase)
MNEKTPRSQLSAKIKDTSNILVTVSRDPSVDQLAAALALTFMLDKLGKHATAVFSGEIPPAINFLEPEKTFEGTVDSLRDFVISLDKEKADRLRYKVEGDLVKIYITPYKTTISEKDLEFNEGDFNIELVIAVGVQKKEDLDEAIAAHGRLLHDATVATISSSEENKGAFGSINWQDARMSSMSEMVSNLVDDLSEKDKPLLDEQIATALLTGVVAATDQFRNDKTSANVMTLAANLMAKGANQQLIASELSAGAGGVSLAANPENNSDEEVIAEQSEPETLLIDRNLAPEADDHLTAGTEAAAAEQNEAALSEAREELATALSRPVVPEPEPAPAPIEEPTSTSEPLPPPAPAPTFEPTLAPVPMPAPVPAPTAPGEAELDAVVANNTSAVLGHSTPYAESAIGAPLSSAVAGSDEPPAVDPFATAITSQIASPMINQVPTLPAAPSLSPPPSIELPPPPPPPTSDLGQLPPLPGATPAPPPAAPPPPDANALFPPVDTNPNDPGQFQIPGQ